MKTTYQYSGDKLVYENRGDEYEFYYSYDGYGNLSCIRRFDSDGFSRTYLVTCNSRGDTEALYSSDGVLIGRYIYDAQGNVISIQDADGNEITSSGNIMTLNSIRYRGYYYDNETGFYYCQSRYYDSVTSRFVNADSLVDNRDATSQNVFAYCGNNPVTRSDSGGQFWHILAGAAVGAIVSGISQVITNVCNNEKLTHGLATAVVSGAASGAIGATGIGALGLIAANAAISGATSVVNQIMDNGEVDAGTVIKEAVIGAALGGTTGGNGSKHMTTQGLNVLKRSSNALKYDGVEAALKETKKAFSYYSKQTGVTLSSIKKELKIGLANIGDDILKESGYGKVYDKVCEFIF